MTYEGLDVKDTGKKVSVIRIDCVIDVKMHDKEKIRWSIILALVDRVYFADVGAHKPSNWGKSIMRP